MAIDHPNIKPLAAIQQAESNDKQLLEPSRTLVSSSNSEWTASPRDRKLSKASDILWGEERSGEGVDIERGKQEFQASVEQVSGSHNRTAARVKSDQEMVADLEAGLRAPEHFDLEALNKHRRKALKAQGQDVNKPIGVLWEHLTVKGIRSQHVFVKALPKAILNTLTAADFFGFFASRFPKLITWLPGRRAQLRTLLRDFNGLLRDEILLVLGRPGSGCSTFLRAIANQREGSAAVEGNVDYAGFSSSKMAQAYRGEVVYNQEDDLHFPKLTVEQALRFALENNVPSARPSIERNSERMG